MKIKILPFILMIIFIISAVHCSVDAVKPNSSASCSMSLTPQFHIYTEQDRQEIYQNLIGRYQGFFNSKSVILDIRTNDTLSITINGTEIVGSYTVLFLPNNNVPVLTFEGYVFKIQFKPHTATQVMSLYSDLIYPGSYIHKLENHETDSHNEL